MIFQQSEGTEGGNAWGSTSAVSGLPFCSTSSSETANREAVTTAPVEMAAVDWAHWVGSMSWR